MLFGLVVMAGIVLLKMVFNNRRRPSRWDGGGSAGDGSPWAYGGGNGGARVRTAAVMPAVGIAEGATGVAAVAVETNGLSA